MKRTAIYPGTFDPVTHGHLDVIQRAARLFDHLIVAVASETRKANWFSLEERLSLLRGVTRGLRTVTIEPFHGLLVDYARRRGVHVLVRGLRAFSDFEYEFQMALSNRKLAPDVETMFLMTAETRSYVSSSTVREVAELGGSTRDFVPPLVQRALARKLRDRRATG
jgi:pantetheine-phosphate adenylyltransferase